MNRVDAARLAYGSALVVAPAVVLRIYGTSVTLGQRRVARLAGVRHVIQGLATIAAPTSRVRRAGAAVDAVHAMTDLAAGLAWPSWRVVAAADGSVAMALAALDLRASTAHPAPERDA